MGFNGLANPLGDLDRLLLRIAMKDNHKLFATVTGEIVFRANQFLANDRSQFLPT